MTAGDLTLTEPSEEIPELNRKQEMWRQIRYNQMFLTPEAGQNVANFTRFYVTASRDMTAALAMSNLTWDDSVFHELVKREQDQRDSVYDWAYGAVKGLTRWGFGMADAAVDEAIQKPLRIGVRQATTDESLKESYMAAGSSPIGQAARAWGQGKKVDSGEGFFFQPQTHMTFEDAERFRTQIEEQRATGQPLDMVEQTQQLKSMQEQIRGVDIAAKAEQSLANTQITKTMNGQEYSVPASWGNAAAIQVFRPDTMPYNIMSIGTDLGLLVAFDPINSVADTWTKTLKARRTAVPVEDLEDLYRSATRRMFKRQGIALDAEPPKGKDWLGSQSSARAPGPDIEIYDTRGGYKNFLDWANEENAVFDLSDPYQAAQAEIWDSPAEMAAYFEAHGGDKSFFDWVVEHELGHRMDTVAYDAGLDRIDKARQEMDDLWDYMRTGDEPIGSPEFQDLQEQWQRAQADLYEAKHDMIQIKFDTEMSAERHANRGLVGNSMQATRMRRTQEAASGMGFRWRKWIRPTAVDDWAGQRRGRRVLDFLAREGSVAAIARRLPDLDPRAWVKIAHATDSQEVFSILRPYLGKQLDEFPRRGVGRPVAPRTWVDDTGEILDSEVPLDPSQGPGGGMTRIKADDPLSMELRAKAGPSRVQVTPDRMRHAEDYIWREEYGDINNQPVRSWEGISPEEHWGADMESQNDWYDFQSSIGFKGWRRSDMPQEVIEAIERGENPRILSASEAADALVDDAHALLNEQGSMDLPDDIRDEFQAWYKGWIMASITDGAEGLMARWDELGDWANRLESYAGYPLSGGSRFGRPIFLDDSIHEALRFNYHDYNMTLQSGGVFDPELVAWSYEKRLKELTEGTRRGSRVEVLPPEDRYSLYAQGQQSRRIPGFVFHGTHRSGTVDWATREEITGAIGLTELETGGISAYLDRSRTYTKEWGGQRPAVYVIRVEDLPQEMLDHLIYKGDIEQFISYEQIQYYRQEMAWSNQVWDRVWDDLARAFEGEADEWVEVAEQYFPEATRRAKEELSWRDMERALESEGEPWYARLDPDQVKQLNDIDDPVEAEALEDFFREALEAEDATDDLEELWYEIERQIARDPKLGDIRGATLDLKAAGVGPTEVRLQENWVHPFGGKYDWLNHPQVDELGVPYQRRPFIDVSDMDDQGLYDVLREQSRLSAREIPPTANHRIPIYAELSPTDIDRALDLDELDFNTVRWWRGAEPEIMEDDWGRMVDEYGDLLNDDGMLPHETPTVRELEVNRAAGGHWEFKHRKENPFSRFGRRYSATASQGALMIDPMDVRRTVSGVNAWLDTIGAPQAQVDEIIEKLIDARGNWNKTQAVAVDMQDAFQARLVEMGYNEEVVRHVMNQFQSSILTHKVYFDDMMAHPIDEMQNQVAVLRNPETGEVVSYRPPTAVREAQFYHRNIALPGVRDVRVATSKIRSTVNKLGQGWLIDTGIDAAEAKAYTLTYMRYRADQFMAGWRNFALLRVGWPLRVLPDEFLRIMASGYADSFRNPFSLIALTLGRKGGIDLLGGDMNDWVKMKSGGLGVGEHARDMKTNLPLSAKRFDAHEVSWVRANLGERGYNAGLSRALIQLRSSTLAQLVATHGVDEAFRILKSGDYDDLLQEIALEAGKNNKMSKIATDDHLLRRTLESQEAQIARYSGGDFYYQKDLGNGTWVWHDKNGAPVDMFDQMSGQELKDALRAENVLGRGSARNKEQMRRLLQRHRYGLDFEELPADLMYYTTNQGSPRIREWIGTGVDPMRPDQVLLPDKPDLTDFERFEAEVLDFFDDDYQPAPRVHAPDGTKADTVASAGERVTERFFYGLGGLPTTKLMRHPMFLARYNEIVARFYVFADDATRTQIRGWAEASGMSKDLDHAINVRLGNMGMRNLPDAGIMPLSLEEIDEIAKFQSIDDVRGLLYDLSQSGNWADALRLVFPFADAWWEVITRWTKLYNPYLMGGQALRNYRKPVIAMQAASKYGWFQEDQYGNDVFNVGPASHTFGGFKMQQQMGLNQLMFVDPSNFGSVVKPGSSPLVQFAGSAVDATGLLPHDMQDALNWAVFGEYEPGGFSSFGDVIRPLLPTPYKRIAAAVLEDEFRADMGNEIVQATSGLCMAGGNDFNCATTEGLQLAQKQAEKVGSQLSLMRIFHGFVFPGQPRNTAMIQVINESLDVEDPYTWVSVAAYGQEYRAAEEVLGSREAAVQYMISNFGPDPLMLVSGSRPIKQRPATEQKWRHLDAHPELLEHADLTLMAFLPEFPDDPFSRKAWDEQMSGANPDREKVTTAEEAAMMISWNLANNEWQLVKDEVEKVTAEAKETYKNHPHTLRRHLTEIKAWKDMRAADIWAQYAAFGEDGPTFTTIRPSYSMYVKELMKIGDPSTEANRVLSQTDPELVGFIEHAMEMWTNADEYSRQTGRTSEWWRTAITTRELDPGEEDEAQKVRDWFVGGLDWYIQENQLDWTEHTGAYWLVNRIFKPLLADKEIDDVLWLDGTPPPPPPAILPEDLGATNG